MPRLDARERQLCQTIASRGEAMQHELAEHVAIPTGTGYAPGLEQYRALLIERLTTLGASIEIIEGDPRPAWLDPSGKPDANAAGGAPIVIARHKSAGDSPRILIAGHLDTVHDPHGPFRELTVESETVARGPGAADMKGGVLIALHALEAIVQSGIDVNWTLLLNCDEETGSFQSARILREVAQQHDIGICVEPALPRGELAVARFGSGQFMIEVHGRSAHVGREFEKGVSAVYKLAEVISSLSRLAKPDEGMIVNVGPLRGGAVTNAVPDYAACWGNVRYHDPEAGRKLAEAIDALATSDDDLPRVIVHRAWNRPAKPATDHVMDFARAIQQAAPDLAQSIEFTSTGGVCDGNILQDAGLPTIDTLGVRGGNLHRPDEFIELPSIVERCQLLAVILARLANGRVTIPANAVDKAMAN